MNTTINALIAVIVLGGLVLKMASAAPDPRHWIGGNVRGLAQSLLGVGLLGYVLTPFTGRDHEGAQTALLVGLAVLLLVRWRRRSES